MNLDAVIVEPMFTEKSTGMREAQNKYVFKVDRRATKHEIILAVNTMFDVHCTKCNVMNMAGKKRRTRYVQGYRSAWKKAIVTLKEGETIDVFAS